MSEYENHGNVIIPVSYNSDHVCDDQESEDEEACMHDDATENGHCIDCGKYVEQDEVDDIER